MIASFGKAMVTVERKQYKESIWKVRILGQEFQTDWGCKLSMAY